MTQQKISDNLSYYKSSNHLISVYVLLFLFFNIFFSLIMQLDQKCILKPIEGQVRLIKGEESPLEIILRNSRTTEY